MSGSEMTPNATMTDGSAATIPEIVLQTRGLGQRFGGEDQPWVLKDLDIEVHRGEVVCLVGPSGAGKTTTLRCLTGLMTPTEGEVLFEGQRITAPPDKLAVVFQDYRSSLLPWLSVRANVLLPLRGKGVSAADMDSRCTRALATVGLSDAADLAPWQLSGGMQQRVAIARALAYEPHVLLMDEPFASVDAQTRADLEDVVVALQGEYHMTILVVTHDIDEAVYLGDRVVVLSKGPATVRANVGVPLGRPRDQIVTKSEPEFAELRSQILELVRAQARG